MKKRLCAVCLAAMLPLLGLTTGYEAMPPPAGADFSPCLMTAKLTPPLAKAGLTDPFGWRIHPIDGGLDFHYGADLAAEEGEPVRAVMGGTVKTAETHESYGRYLVIDHGNGFSTLYAHCSRLLVREGAEVQAGQKVARVGQTGAATGPHLHFEVMLDGKRLDPLWLLGDGEELTAFGEGGT